MKISKNISYWFGGQVILKRRNTEEEFQGHVRQHILQVSIRVNTERHKQGVFWTPLKSETLNLWGPSEIYGVQPWRAI